MFYIVLKNVEQNNDVALDILDPMASQVTLNFIPRV